MRRYVALIVLVFALVAPSTAASGGWPVIGADAGPEGVTMPGLAYRWVTVRVRGHTLIAVIERRGGRVDVTRIVRAPLVVPAVAYDRTGTGLSADGTTLVLADERNMFPRRRSRFAMLDANTLWPLRTVTLRGHFALAAVSPDGGRLYLLQAKTQTRYVIRVYDVAKRRLLAEEVGELDRNPLARAVSPDGRWAYTLCDRNGTEFFVHALDTERGVAQRIDLEGAAPDDLSVGRDGALILTEGGEVVQRVDPQPAGLLGWFALVRDNVRAYATARLERRLVRTHVGAAGGDGP